MMGESDRRYMRRALALARKGLGLASPNPTVGCFIVRDGQVVGQGLHEYSGLDHAEVRALQQAGGRARGSTVYVTLEPCCCQGRTPPCAERLMKAGIRRAVVAAIDPNPLVSGRGISALRSSGIQVDLGLLENDSLALIEPFACSISTGLPLVVAKAGLSLDGRIATRLKKARWITSEEGREFGQQLRLQLDALVVGVGTVLADDPQLSYRGRLPKARPLIKAVLDSWLRTPTGASIVKTARTSPVILFCRQDAPVSRRRALEARGAEVIAVPHGKGGLDLPSVIGELGRRSVRGILVEGGGAVHWSFLSSGLVDKFYFIVAPLVLGGQNAVPAVGGRGYDTVGEALRFRIRRNWRAGPDFVFEAYPSNSRSILSPWRLCSGIPPSVERGTARSSRRR